MPLTNYSQTLTLQPVYLKVAEAQELNVHDVQTCEEVSFVTKADPCANDRKPDNQPVHFLFLAQL